MKNIITTSILLIFAGLLSTSCGGSAPSKKQNQNTSLSIEKAKQIIDQFIKNKGLSVSVNSTVPKNISEIFQIIKADETLRFEASQQLLENMNGRDVLYVRSMLDLARAGMMQMNSQMLKEMATRKLAEYNRLATMEQNGAELSQHDKDKMQRLNDKASKFIQVSEALQTIMNIHITSGESLANELVRQFPESPDGFIMRAYAYRLKGGWTVFSGAISQAERLAEKNDRLIRYQRAMEKLQRFRLKDAARKELEQLRTELPDWIRIQAILVTIANDINQAHIELEKLKKLSPNHIVIQLLGNDIENEYAISASLEKEITSAEEPDTEIENSSLLDTEQAVIQ